MRCALLKSILGTLAFFLLATMPLHAEERLQFDLPPQDLLQSLRAIGERTGTNVLASASHIAGLKAPMLKGEMTADEAFRRLLAGTGLKHEFLDEKTVTFVAVGDKSAGYVEKKRGVRVAQVDFTESGSGRGDNPNIGAGEEDQSSTNTDNTAATVKKEEEDPGIGGIPEVLVIGSKVLNTDIRRTENDIQPYVIFDRERIARSGAANLEEFLNNELTMNTSAQMADQNPLMGNRSRINLRGLGADETLILIDGRRVAGFNFEGTPNQPDINSIPLAAVERIDVLPTTASGIFGGGATGGAINLVLRRDYAGLASQLTYGNTFSSDAATRHVDLSGGFNIEGGKTNVMVAASYSDANPLLVRERDLFQRGRQRILDSHGGDPQAFNIGDAPPLGATPNVRSANGNLVLDSVYGGTDLGSEITHLPVGYAGVALDGTAPLVANAGQYNLDLAPTGQFSGGGRSGLLGTPEVKSLMMTLRREFTPRVQAFLELQASESSTRFLSNFANLTGFIEGDALNNPFQQGIWVTLPTVGLDQAVSSEAEDRRVVTGVIARLPREWQAAIDFTWNRSRSSYAEPHSELSDATAPAISSGALDVMRDINQFPIAWEVKSPGFQSPGDMSLENIALRVAGPLPWGLGGGYPMLTSLVEHREESVDDTIIFSSFSGERLIPARSQNVSSLYLEARLPFVSARNREAGIELLEMQLAARYDDYSVTGATGFIDLSAPTPIERFTNKNSSVDPTIGLRYQPLPDLTLRASCGTGYLPPSMMQVVPDPSFLFPLGFFITDPLRGNQPVGTVGGIVEIVQGGNPDLQPEESESASFGLILTPHALQGLRIAIDWTQISKSNNINNPAIFLQRDFERLMNLFPARITRAEPSDGFPVGRIIKVDATRINVARMKTEAVEIGVDYKLESLRFGTFDLSLDTTHLISLESQLRADAPVDQEAGVLLRANSGGGLKWKANVALNWIYRGWSLGWRTRYFDSYYFDALHTVNPNQGVASVPRQVYHDLHGGFRFAGASEAEFRWLADTEIRFGVNNVFNKEPPVDVVSGLPAMYSSLGDPRLANYYLSIRKSFDR